MEPSFELVASSDPPRACLANWWRAVAKRIRDSYDKKMIPEDLKTAMKGRSKLYLSALGDAMDIVDLAAEALAVEHAAEASDVGLSPAKRSRGSVSRSRVDATSSSSSSQYEPDSGSSRVVPVWLGWRSRFRYGVGPSGFLVGLALCGFTAEELGLLKPLLQRLLERL